MKRALLLAAAVGAFAAPATAQAVTWKGAVIAKNAKRHALVTTTRSGAVRTVRAPKAFRKARVGSLVAVRGAALPDGTYTGTVRPLVPRTFAKLSDAEEENGQSRIYLGIHWRFDKTEGIAMGRKVGDHVFNNAFQPVK